jgi:signal transduction histidine kinase
MRLTPPTYLLLLGMTAVIGVLSAALAFAILRFLAANRETRRLRRSGTEMALLSAALETAVTKLKAQQVVTTARAEASERLSGEIISSLTAGLLVVGLQGEVRILNPAGRRMLHLADDVTLTNYREELREPGLVATIDQCLNSRTAVVRRAIEVLDRGSGTTHLGVTVSPMSDGNGELHGAICLFTDLTMVKQLEEQLRLKESLATVGELTAGIAHEFRNGLATILGYSKLCDPQNLPEAYRPYVAGIRAEAESLRSVVTNFLNFAKPATLTLSKVNLQAICERASEEVRAEARSLGGEVTLDGEFGALDGDEVLLRQAFSNLLRNAVEACAAAAVPPRVVIRSEVDRAHQLSRIVVEDNGPGIPLRDRDQVFRPFFTSKRSGTGLGLALVQKIVVFHNGRISVGSSSLGGASLHISLPLAS